MKAVKSDIVRFFLVACVLFGTTGVNFFHDGHHAHEHLTKEASKQTSVVEHGEHCKICSLDLIIQSDIVSQTAIYCEPVLNKAVVFFGRFSPTVIPSYTQDRAPPAC